MSKSPKATESKAFYLNPDRSVAVINYSEEYIQDIFQLVNSQGFYNLVDVYLQESQLAVTNKVEALDAKAYIDILKAILIDNKAGYEKYGNEQILKSIEELYSYYRSYFRVSLINKHNSAIVKGNFMNFDNHFNEIVIQMYRSIEEKLQGFTNKAYRQVNAGTNACVLTQSIQWNTPQKYQSLESIRFLDTLMLRPPMMMHTKSNKREGVFSEVFDNPIDKFDGNQKDWYCFPAKIGESLAFIYFHRDYFVSGIALANLFEVADKDSIAGQKPDEILLFGLNKTKGDVSHYYHDTDNNIWVGEVPYNDKTTYFGYMKKMCLTLHNLHMIYENRLPIHGSMVKISFSNGKTKSVVFFGDSGAGKSESIEALQEIADDKIINIETIFDDMGSFAFDDQGNVYAQGTETGAFVRLDDLSSSVAFNNMDRGIYLNPELKNARVILPANTYKHVVEHYSIDMWVYANNYDAEIGLHQFPNEEKAKATFIAGKRKALGTTDEVGMSTTFFANPFGPVQEEEKTRPIIDKVFNKLYQDNIYVGEIYTHLGYDKSKASLHESAKELLTELMNN
ncbi:phosphoenolpyruvate carboxykinase [Companilactobacillus alimentarius]|uniref:phosphoenolpyruvate carboxykinase n=1 Tax=Companilactobacillus alimentarius TaxID=1602 RepID=UPI0028B33A36|nr:phosphoenolpyruvate carboxykinase [Companilactobacillus alimentarius]MDT6952823.1 phosphoenolpyruvate carboxykinase [Companilactobacillus alimentarius]